MIRCEPIQQKQPQAVLFRALRVIANWSHTGSRGPTTSTQVRPRTKASGTALTLLKADSRVVKQICAEFICREPKTVLLLLIWQFLFLKSCVLLRKCLAQKKKKNKGHNHEMSLLFIAAAGVIVLLQSC